MTSTITLDNLKFIASSRIFEGSQNDEEIDLHPVASRMETWRVAIKFKVCEDLPVLRVPLAQEIGLQVSDGAHKFDNGKLPWHLVPWDAVREIVRVLDYGTRKYAPGNWAKGMDWDRPFDACLRHLTAWHEGETYDPETGLNHLAHAGCNIFFLLAYQVRGTGKDTR